MNIWVIQNEENGHSYEASSRIVTENFWFSKPTLQQILLLGFPEERAKAILENGVSHARWSSWYLREFKEGSLE